MMLRVFAALAIALGGATLLLYLNELGRTPWSSPAARHMRQMKDRTAAPRSFGPMTIAQMGLLPRSRPVAEYAAIERRGVTVEGYVQRLLRAPDGDFPLDFAPETKGTDGPLVPYVSAEVTPPWHRGSPRWRYARLAGLFRPVFGGSARWSEPPRRVRLSGWLMYDYEHEGVHPPPPFPPRVAVWEIHPVTRIEYWDEGRQAFVEFPR